MVPIERARRDLSIGATLTSLGAVVSELRHPVGENFQGSEMYVAKSTKMPSSLEGMPLGICLDVLIEKVHLHRPNTVQVQKIINY